MTEQTQFVSAVRRHAGRATSAYRVVASQPSWVTRAALMAFIIVIGVPLLLLVLTAVAVMLVVFLALALVNRALSALRGVLPRSDGRANVRVMQRSESYHPPR